MRSIKTALDPLSILNPGRVLPLERRRLAPARAKRASGPDAWRCRPGPAPGEAGHQPRRPDAAPIGLTIGLVLAVTVTTLESLTVLSIMPIVARDLDGLDLYGWVFAGFFLTLGHRHSDRGSDRSIASGLRWPFIVGLALFGGGLLIAGLAPSMLVLVGGRVLQGVGAGTLSAVTYASVAMVYAPRDRAQILALYLDRLARPVVRRDRCSAG